MELISLLAAWMMPTLALNPFQWVQKLNGNQILDSLQLFQPFQNYCLEPTITQMAFLFHLFGCYVDFQKCTKWPPILAFKKNSSDEFIIGMIRYAQLSIVSPYLVRNKLMTCLTG